MDSSKQYNDAEILTRIASGDRHAMEVVFEAFYPRLVYFSQKLTAGSPEAEDIAQDALLSLWTNVREKGTQVQHIESYLFQIVRNRCYTHNRHERMKAGKKEQLASQSDLFDEEFEKLLIREDIFNKVYQAFKILPEQQELIMKMLFVDGLDTNEISARLGITPNNIRNQKARALEKLRMFLAGSVKFFYFFINLL